MGTDGLVYKREASEQDDTVEDLVNITKGLTLTKKKTDDKPTEDIIHLLDSLKLSTACKKRGTKTKNQKNNAELQKRGPGLITPIENGYWPPSTSTKREPDYLFGRNINQQSYWPVISKEYNYAPGLDSGCQIWNEAAQNCSLMVHQNKTAQKMKELSNKYHTNSSICQRDVKDLDVTDGLNSNASDLECDGYAPTMALDECKLNGIPLGCPTLDLIDNVIRNQDQSSPYIASPSPSYRRTSPFYASSPSSGYSGSPSPPYSNEPSPSYAPSPAYPALSPPAVSQTSRSPVHPESVNLPFRDLEDISREDLVGTTKKMENFLPKTTKRPSSTDDESKPSPPKRTNVDAMYDKDLDEDNILHSLIIAGAQIDLIEYVLQLLQEDGEDVLKKIINDQNHMQRTPLFLAVLEGRVNVVEMLLKHGADPNIQGKVIVKMDQYELRAPLHIAAEMGDEYLEVVNALVLCEETDLDIRSLSDRVTPLNLALQTHRCRKSPAYPNSCKKCIQLLVDSGVDTDEMDEKSSKTPLMLVIDTMDLDLIKFFLCADTSTQHADVMSKLQAVTRGGDTPLHIAAGVKMKSSREKQKLLRILIRHGADANAKNNVNEVPKDIATNEVWKDIFKETFK
ncbi:poly [ADP-ribose] polymerase tankyrase-1-like isoform X2 [Ostrea edulis]|uniref:poly [ADP-ribose] polymerase tankyrase-1-like isoform X2 n=1 Tax=Ostrea edulis TaxID=37623 RepID=UPI0024AEAB1E|nr:poly [ADP-ribose] polymerase tankyrase-1-like isoform X2 [Ostrea edulis]